MTTYRYPVLAFRQQNEAPVQVAFVAPAGDLVSWAGTPRKSDELLTGFQRFRDDARVNQQIVPFFQDPKNCSPTAIIVALRSNSGLGTCKLDCGDLEPGQVVETFLTIEVDEGKLESDAIFTSALEYIRGRIAADADQPADDQGDDLNGDDEEDVEEDDGEGDGEDQIVHLGSETLAEMNRLLEDRSKWSNPNFRAAIKDYVKPAFLIDGQHRAAAAARIGPKGLPFIVCGLYDAPWEEQVFQFTIVNVKPKRIPPSLIASIAALSLSRSEQRVLQQRLEQAGIKMDEVEIMSLVAYHDDSPFAQMVDMGVGGAQVKSTKLGYGGVKRIAKVWYRASRNSLTQIAKSCFETNNANHARAKWRQERLWFQFFCEFWATVKNSYAESLWVKGDQNKLFIAAHLWALQEAILGEADGQMPSFWKLPEGKSPEERATLLVERLKEVTASSLVYIPEDMWRIPWSKASQDTNQGREELRALFAKLIDEGKKGGKVWGKWRNEEWFKS
jgi:hypothetical protein